MALGSVGHGLWQAEDPDFSGSRPEFKRARTRILTGKGGAESGGGKGACGVRKAFFDWRRGANA